MQGPYACVCTLPSRVLPGGPVESTCSRLAGCASEEQTGGKERVKLITDVEPVWTSGASELERWKAKY